MAQIKASASTGSFQILSAAGASIGFIDSLSGRRFIDAQVVAEAVGLSAYVLHHYYIPCHWGVPGHWVRVNCRTFYALDRLGEVVDELIAQGLVDRAERLDVFRAELAPAERPADWLLDWEGGRDA